MNNDRYRCQSCYHMLKKIEQTNQYYCDQSPNKCVESLRVFVIELPENIEIKLDHIFLGNLWATLSFFLTKNNQSKNC